MRPALVLLIAIACDTPDDGPVVPDARLDGSADAVTPECASGSCDTLPPTNSTCGSTELAGGPCVGGGSCFVEGTGTCDLPPAGGGCSCAAGRWSCWSSCPDGCPTSAPADGDACAGDVTCRYDTGTVACTCASGEFTCTP